MSKEILHTELEALLSEAEGRLQWRLDRKKWIKSMQKLRGRFISEGKNYGQNPDFDFDAVWDTKLSNLIANGTFRESTLKDLDAIKQGL